jgi:hypothetical protein
VAWDYARAGIGFLFFAAPVLIFPMALVPRMILLSLAAVFLGFGLQTAFRHSTRFTVSDLDIVAKPRGVRLRWRELTDVKLEYYSLQRESKHGWMQLTLRSGRRRLHLDSRLSGFVEIAQRAASSARELHLNLSPLTMNNFAALNIHTGPE